MQHEGWRASCWGSVVGVTAYPQQQEELEKEELLLNFFDHNSSGH